MERHRKQFSLVNGETIHLDLADVEMLEPVGSNCRVVLAIGTDLMLAGSVASVEAVLGEMRLRGVNDYRINPDHVVAIESKGSNACMLLLASGLRVEALDIAAAELSRVIEQQQKYPWDTIRIKRIISSGS